MTNDEYIERVAAERGLPVAAIMREAVARYRTANEDDGSNIYDDALYLQSAANPRAVVARFGVMLKRIAKELETEYGHASTDDITHHPAFVLMADKIQAMAGYGYRYSNAYDEAIKRATPETLALLGIEPRTEGEAA
jgi:hypothetical protein